MLLFVLLKSRRGPRRANRGGTNVASIALTCGVHGYVKSRCSLFGKVPYELIEIKPSVSHVPVVGVGWFQATVVGSDIPTDSGTGPVAPEIGIRLSTKTRALGSVCRFTIKSITKTVKTAVICPVSLMGAHVRGRHGITTDRVLCGRD